MKRPSKAGRARPGPGLRAVWARAHGLERARAAAVVAGDRDRAHALNLDLEDAARDIARAMRAQLRADRAGAAEAAAVPGEARRGGRRMVMAQVPPDRLDRDGDEPPPLPFGTWARPVWGVDMDRVLKFTAATYAGWVEEAAGGRQMRCIDPAVIRVDGGGGGSSPETRLLWVAGRIEVAHRALDGCKGLSALRSHAADRRVTLSARRLVDLVAVEGRALCEVLRMSGWTATGRNKRAIRDVLVAALEAVAREWAGGLAPDHGRVETWQAEDFELLVGATGTY